MAAAAASEPPEESLDIKRLRPETWGENLQDAIEQAKFGALTTMTQENEELWKNIPSSDLKIAKMFAVLPLLTQMYRPFVFHDQSGPASIDCVFEDLEDAKHLAETDLNTAYRSYYLISFNNSRPWTFIHLCNVLAHEMTHIAVTHFVFTIRGLEEGKKMLFSKGEYSNPSWSWHGRWFRTFGNKLGRAFPGLTFGRFWIMDTMKKLREQTDLCQLEGFTYPKWQDSAEAREAQKEARDPKKARAAPRPPRLYVSPRERLLKLHEGDKLALIAHVYGTKYVDDAYKRMAVIVPRAMGMYRQLEKDAAFDKLTTEMEAEMWHNYMIYTEARDDIVVFVGKDEPGMKAIRGYIFPYNVDERILRLLSDTETNNLPLFDFRQTSHPRHDYGVRETLMPRDDIKTYMEERLKSRKDPREIAIRRHMLLNTFRDMWFDAHRLPFVAPYFRLLTSFSKEEQKLSLDNIGDLWSEVTWRKMAGIIADMRPGSKPPEHDALFASVVATKWPLYATAPPRDFALSDVGGAAAGGEEHGMKRRGEVLEKADMFDTSGKVWIDDDEWRVDGKLLSDDRDAPLLKWFKDYVNAQPDVKDRRDIRLRLAFITRRDDFVSYMTTLALKIQRAWLTAVLVL